ncbi:hypothetical protein [Leptospira noguchii]|nr:hypothetical protein [Leptospira noguchii]
MSSHILGIDSQSSGPNFFQKNDHVKFFKVLEQIVNKILFCRKG